MTEGLDLIGQMVSEATGVSIANLKGRRRDYNTVKARATISQMARSGAFGQFSYKQIGRWMNKDHTTIIHHMGMEV